MPAALPESMAHPAADHAKAVLQVRRRRTASRCLRRLHNVLPVGDPQRRRPAGLAACTPGLVRRSLERGFYQGWDLHPAQLASRYAATFRFFTDGQAAAPGPLAAYSARLETGIADEPATVRALTDYLARGVACGALDEPS